MKNLQNHIFSTTTCISKETMLKLINKQLSQKELHRVQIHLVDCDFCSEAVEGLSHAKNSSLLFTIDHQIDQRSIQKNPSIARMFMVAASVLLIAFGGYFTVTNFNDQAKLKENEISYQEPKNNIEEPLMMVQEDIVQKQNEKEPLINMTKRTNLEELAAKTTVIKKSTSAYTTPDENSQKKNVTKNENQGYVSPQKEKTNTTTHSGKAYKTEMSEADDVAKDFESISSPPNQSLKERVNTDATVLQVTNQQSTKVVSTNNLKKSGETKQRAKKALDSPSPSSITDEVKNKMVEDGGINLNPEADMSEDHFSKNETLSFFEASGGINTGSTINLRNILAEGIANYNAKEYTKAIQHFNLIMAEVPTTSKTYEAKWYKALCLIKLNDLILAKKLLNELTYVNNPFSKKAENKLLELK